MDIDEVRAVKAEFLTSRVPSAQGVKTAGVGAPRGVALGVHTVKEGWYELAVRIVRESRAADEFAKIAEDVTGGEIDITTTGPIRAFVGSRERQLRPGASIGHVGATAGTLGAFVRCSHSGKRGVLSNNHVLALENEAKAGDPIVHPGPIDGGAWPADQIGVLDRFVKLKKRMPNRVDAAFAVLDDDVECAVDGPIPLTAVGDIVLREEFPVQKVGRTTAHTTGVVTAFEIDDLLVRFPRLGDITFDGAIEIRGDQGAFSEGGDSGSVIFGRDDAVAYGLVFAGTERDGGLTYGNQMAEVLTMLEAEPLGVGGAT